MTNRERYISIYNKNANFLNERPLLKTVVAAFNRFASYFIAAAYLFLWLYGVWKSNFLPKDYVKIFFAPALTLVAVSVLRLMIERPRPYDSAGAGIEPLQEKREKGNSFPSRHLALGGVVATIFLPYLPVIGGFLFLLTIGLGYARFAMGWHYLGDLFSGFTLGVAVGLLSFLL